MWMYIQTYTHMPWADFVNVWTNSINITFFFLCCYRIFNRLHLCTSYIWIHICLLYHHHCVTTEITFWSTKIQDERFYWQYQQTHYALAWDQDMGYCLGICLYYISAYSQGQFVINYCLKYFVTLTLGSLKSTQFLWTKHKNKTFVCITFNFYGCYVILDKVRDKTEHSDGNPCQISWSTCYITSYWQVI
jgi:hypothetical protein